MPSHPSQPAVAVAILYQGDRFLLQLRDDVPGIAYPGYWAFFGGHLEPGEDPETALHRELLEEISYDPPTATLFQTYRLDDDRIRHVFYAPLTVDLDALQLNEGWDLGLFTIDDIHRGERYSERAGQIRPLGKPHQQILLEFLETLAHQLK